MEAMEPVPLYDAFSADYDRFVNWPARLARELPPLERLFRESGVHRVLDAACGTGQHALALGRDGYEVAGADLSLPMIERARANAAAAGVKATFVVAGLGELAKALPGPFDAVICLGNSLPHLLTAQAVQAALADLAALLRSGGRLVIQNRNYDRVWRERERFMPLEVHREGEQEWLFFRFVDLHEATLTFNVVTLERCGGRWSYRAGATELRPILAGQLAADLQAAGFVDVVLWGDYEGAPFDAQTSSDLIAAARKS
jgi:SAM-dependent methyltransferase